MTTDYGGPPPTSDADAAGLWAGRDSTDTETPGPCRLVPGEHPDRVLIAASVAASGWPVLALWPGTKKPTHRGSETPNHGDHWLTSPAAVALSADEHDDREPPPEALRGCPSYAAMTGQPSPTLDGLALVALDLDGDPAALATLLAEAGPDAVEWAAETLRVQRTADRAHLWGTVPGDECPPTGDLAPGLEWRGSTQYAALPGSRHKSGALYEVTGGRYEFTDGGQPDGALYVGMTDPDDADPLGLAVWVHPLPVPASLLAVIRERLGVGREARPGLGMSTAEAREFYAARSTATAESFKPGLDQSRGGPGSTARRLEALARAVTDAPAGQGNACLNWSAGKAAALCATDAEAPAADEVRAALVAAYLARPIPAGESPRSREAEARRTVASGWRWGSTHPVDALTEHHDRHAHAAAPDDDMTENGGGAVTLHEVAGSTGTTSESDPKDLHDNRVTARLDSLRVQRDALRLLKAEEAAADAANLPPFDAGTLAEVLARPPEPPHRVEGLILSDALTLIVAMRKTGKTTLCLNLARSLLTGEPFLDSFAVRALRSGERVALLNYEVSAALVAEWAERLKVPGDRLVLVTLRGRRNPLAHEADREALADYLRGLRVASVMGDPFSRMFTGDNANDAGQVTAFLSEFDTWAREAVGARDVLLTAHAGWEGERARNSSALEDAPDSILTLTTGARTGDPSGRYLRALGRGVEVEEDRLTFDPVTLRMGMSGRGSRAATGDALAVDRLVPEVVVYVAEHPGCSGRDLEAGLPGRGARVREAVRMAVGRGLVRTEPGPRRATLHYPSEPTTGEASGIGDGDGSAANGPETSVRPSASQCVPDAVSECVRASYRDADAHTHSPDALDGRDADALTEPGTVALDLSEWGQR